MRRFQQQRLTEARAPGAGHPQLVRKKFIMQVTRILSAAILSFVTLGAMAQEIDRSASPSASTRSAAAVRAEAQNARAEGPAHWASGGELRDATPVDAVDSTAVALTRQDVRGQVAQARAAHQLPRVGELM